MVLSCVLGLLSAWVLFADVTVIAPKDGATVSLLKEPQRGYLASPRGERWSRMGDAAARAAFAQCGGRPAPVTLAWNDTAFDTNASYAVELTCRETGQTDRFAVKGAQRAEIVNLEAGRHYVWSVGGSSAAFLTANEPRLMFFPGVGNCRDIGGRAGLGGRRVRQGRVYRTAAYNGSSRKIGDSLFDARFQPGPLRITKAGRREMVEACGIRTDLDLRNEAECAGMPASPLGTNVVWVHIPIRAYGWLKNDAAALGRALKVFADASAYPVAFHCSGGRDRAGSLAFVLEGLLGVAEDDLMKDWEFSIFETDDPGFAPSRIEGLTDMLSHEAGDTINARIESFVKACGLTDADIAAIRNNLLEK